MKNKIDLIGDNIKIVFSEMHKSTSDTFDLARFSMPKSGEKAIDLGCGCGGILLWWYAHGYNGKTIAIDIQDDACILLNESVRLSGLEECVTVLCEDMRCIRESKKLSKSSIDVIACNPPYYNAGKVSHVLSKSMANHETVCTIDDVMFFASMYLKDKGRLCMSYRIDRLSDIIVSMRRCGIEPKKIWFATAGNRRIIKTFFAEGIKGGSPGGLVGHLGL